MNEWVNECSIFAGLRSHSSFSFLIPMVKRLNPTASKTGRKINQKGAPQINLDKSYWDNSIWLYLFSLWSWGFCVMKMVSGITVAQRVSDHSGDLQTHLQGSMWPLWSFGGESNGYCFCNNYYGPGTGLCESTGPLSSSRPLGGRCLSQDNQAMLQRLMLKDTWAYFLLLLVVHPSLWQGKSYGNF
jgi:hypothetical protein